MMAATTAKAAPVQFNQVVQVINAKPGKANTGGFAQLRLAGDDLVLNGGDDPKTEKPPVQDDRVITETRSEIVEEEVCDCEPIRVGGGFPYWTLGFAALPLIFLIPPGGDTDDSPTPTPPGTPPTTTPTPTGTPTATPTATPPTTPTPPTEPVPEPMTILLFGTGLASIGLAARRRFGKKEEDDETEE
jgi:hypothetical protein